MIQSTGLQSRNKFTARENKLINKRGKAGRGLMRSTGFIDKQHYI